MVYRLVAKDTLEEKVMALKARKAALFDRVLDHRRTLQLRRRDGRRHRGTAALSRRTGGFPPGPPPPAASRSRQRGGGGGPG